MEVRADFVGVKPLILARLRLEALQIEVDD